MKVFFFILFCSFISVCYTQTLLNKNRFNITSALTLFYSFTDQNSIQINLVMNNNAGWITMGFGSTQTNIDMIRVYMSNLNIVVEDLYSQGDFKYNLDTSFQTGTNDVTLVSGSRVNGLLNVSFSRFLNTGDTYDFIIVDGSTTKCLFIWQSTTDDIAVKYNNGPIPMNVFFTTQQLCHSHCTSNSMSCVGPDYGDCVCPVGSFMNATLGTCVKCIDQCDKCIDQNSCTNCASNYFYQRTPLKCTLCSDGNQFKDTANNACSICDSNCASCSSDILCGTCSLGFYLNLENKCSACIANCGVCTNSSNCQSCKDGFYSASNACNPCPNNCKLCQSATQCTQCLANYYFSGSSCVGCNSTGQLKQGVNDGSGTCIACVANCASCQSATVCNQCADGYGLNVDKNACSQCTITNCKSCPSGTQICSECLSGYNLISNTCQLCSVKNCLVCDETGKVCLTCAENYIAFKGICSLCQAGNCAFCGPSDNKTCAYCSESYYLASSGLCLQSGVENCMIPWGQASCLSCLDGYALSNNISCFECGVRNCQTCSSNNICFSCNKKYFLQNNYCAKCTSNCDICSDANTCTTCAQSYYLDANKKCSPCAISNCLSCATDPASCDQCNSGYILSANKKSCSLCTTLNCSQCSNTATCTACQTGFYLSSDKSCVKCAQEHCSACSSAASCDKCSDGYSLSSNSTVCLHCPFETCAQCLYEDLQCSICKPQFYFNNVSNSCISCQSNCLNCESDSSCSKCSLGYYLKDKACWTCNEHCANCNESTCIECFPGYKLNSNNQCILCNTANCQKCSANNKCSLCNSGFTLNTTSQTCGCSESQILNTALQACVNCDQLYSNCYSCNSTKCLTCNPGFYQSSVNGQCVACNQDPKCGVCNTTSCVSCVSGYYLQPNGSCSSCFVDCATCTGPSFNQCLSCVSDYFLLSGKSRCATNKCSNIPLCKSCARQTDGTFTCVECADHYFMDPDLGYCDYCDPSCLTCSDKGTNNCLTCPSYALFFKETSTCVSNCSSTCLTCDGVTSNDCVSCEDNKILFNKQCVDVNQARQTLNNFTASKTGVSTSLTNIAKAIRSFTERTAQILTTCSNNEDCFNNGECFQSICLCRTGYKGNQCQITSEELQFAINKTNEIVDFVANSFISGKRILADNTTNTTNSTNSTNSSTQTNTTNNSSTQTTSLTNIEIAFSTLSELTGVKELWTNWTSINSTVKLINSLLTQNLALLTQNSITIGFQALSNMVHVINGIDLTAGILNRSQQVSIYNGFLNTINVVLNTTVSLLKTTGASYQIYTPYLKIVLNSIDLSSSQSPKFTVYSSGYYNTNEVYMTQISFTADSTSLISKINGGNFKVILKQVFWKSANPFPEDRTKQENLTLATGISSVEIFKISGEYLSISGISDYIAIRIKKINPTSNLDTDNTNERYACAFWDKNSNLWTMEGLNNDKTTDSNNYIGCYTNHLSDFTVVYRNKTAFFALEFVEVFIYIFTIMIF